MALESRISSPARPVDRILCPMTAKATLVDVRVIESGDRGRTGTSGVSRPALSCTKCEGGLHELRQRN